MARSSTEPTKGGRGDTPLSLSCPRFTQTHTSPVGEQVQSVATMALTSKIRHTHTHTHIHYCRPAHIHTHTHIHCCRLADTHTHIHCCRLEDTHTNTHTHSLV